MPWSGTNRTDRREVSDAGRAIGRLVGYLSLALLGSSILWHFPYDTDATAPPTEDELRSARNFYEAAYQPVRDASRGLEYEEVATEAALTMGIEGQVRDFVDRHRLADKRVLDVGSGRGYLQDLVADYTGLDLSTEVASHYHKPFVVGSATDMPFPDNSFDAAWTIWVLEHIPTPQKALEEMRRVVKPGGVLYLLPAWNSAPWLADGFEVRPYSDFTLAGKLVKASVPIRRSPLFVISHVVPIRMIRTAQFGWLGGETPLRFRRLQPNYDVYWQPDSDAAVSLDHFETRLWFESRGDECLNCQSRIHDIIKPGTPLEIRVNKP